MSDDNAPVLDLTACLTRLERASANFPVLDEYLLADLVLFSLAADVREHAEATKILVGTPFGRAAYANARAALEAAIDADYLTDNRVNYNMRAARARAHELFEHEELQRRGGSDPRKIADITDRIVEEATALEERSPQSANSIRKAWELLDKSPAARKHWSGLTREALHAIVFPGDGVVDIGGMSMGVHGMLASGAHPRPRIGGRVTAITDDGTLTINTQPADTTFVRGVAALACEMTTAAIARRMLFVGD